MSVVVGLCIDGYKQRETPVRLLGVGVRFVDEGESVQEQFQFFG